MFPVYHNHSTPTLLALFQSLTTILHYLYHLRPPPIYLLANMSSPSSVSSATLPFIAPFIADETQTQKKPVVTATQIETLPSLLENPNYSASRPSRLERCCCCWYFHCFKTSVLFCSFIIISCRMMTDTKRNLWTFPSNSQEVRTR